MTKEGVPVDECARWLIRIARDVRLAGDMPLVLLSEEGVKTQVLSLSGELELVAMQLDYDAVMAMPDYQPTPLEFVKNALGYSPYDGLYLCDKCGITWDGECNYGGWHDGKQRLEVSFAD